MLTKIKLLLTKKEWLGLPILFVLMMVSMLLEAVGVGMVLPIVSVLMGSESGQQNETIAQVINQYGIGGENQLIVAVMIFFMAVYAIKNIYLVYYGWWQINYTMNMKVRISKDLMSLYLMQPYTFHLERNSAQLIRNIISEASMVTGRVITPLIILASESLIVLALISMMLYVEPFGTLIVAAIIGISTGLFYLYSHNKMSELGVVRQVEEGMRLQHLQQGLGSIKDVILSGKKDSMVEKFHSSDKRLGDTLKFQHVIQQIPRLLLELVVVMGIAFIVISMILIGKNHQEIIPTLAFFAATSIRIVPSASRILSSMHSLKYGIPALNVLTEDINLIKKSRSNEKQSKAMPFDNQLRLQNVSFYYNEQHEQVLKDINLCVKKGEFVGIVGKSGVGKSTLLDLILGLHKPTEGKILVDDKDINSDVSAWQKNIGYVSQNIFLMDDSLINNIAFGVNVNEIDENQIDNVLERVQLTKMCKNLPNGKETLLGENGVRISGGQKQRIGIARALYHNPEVLVLDEATSALDKDTESSIMSDIANLKGAVTTIIVSHKKNTVKDCNTICEINDNQKITEERGKS